MKRTPFALVARHAVVETEAKKPAGPKMGRIAGVVAFKCSQPSRVRPTHSGQCSTSNDKLNAASRRMAILAPMARAERHLRMMRVHRPTVSASDRRTRC